jgi:uncharacterized protein (TIGR04141 family)
VAAGDDGFLCFDRADISPVGHTQIEPCDLYSVDGQFAVFHHVKRSTVSAQLSHLFNQGTNAVEMLKLEGACLANLRDLVTARSADAARQQFLEPLNGQQFRVVFGIVTHKDKAKKSENLPLFSRVSLMRISRDLKIANTECRFGFIEDLSEKKPGVVRKRRRKAPVADAA